MYKHAHDFLIAVSEVCCVGLFKNYCCGRSKHKLQAICVNKIQFVYFGSVICSGYLKYMTNSSQYLKSILLFRCEML